MKLAIEHSTVLVTGGASGIGLAIAKQFQAAGAKVIICGRDAASLARAKSLLPGVVTLQCDVADSHQVGELVRTLTDSFPELNILVNNAGVLSVSKILGDVDFEKNARSQIEINLLAPILLTQRLLPLLLAKPSSAVCFTSSVAAVVSFKPLAVYSASKAGLHSFVRSLRRTFKAKGLSVFEVLPGVVDTKMTETVSGSKVTPDQVASALLTSIRRGRGESFIGQAKILAIMSRIALSFTEKLMDAATDKAIPINR